LILYKAHFALLYIKVGTAIILWSLSYGVLSASDLSDVGMVPHFF